MTLHHGLPKTWDGYRMQYRFYNTTYKVEFKIRGEPTHHVAQVLLDGVEQPNKSVQMVDDRNEHRVEVVLGV